MCCWIVVVCVVVWVLPLLLLSCRLVALLWLSILVFVGVLSLLICRCLPCLWGYCCFVVVSRLMSCCYMLWLCFSVVVVLC